MNIPDHDKPRLNITERRPWAPVRRRLTPYMGNNSLYTYRDRAGVNWWSDGASVFRGPPPAYLRQAYLSAGLPVDVALSTLPITPSEARLLLGARLAEPIASYEVIAAGVHGSIPVAVFTTGDRQCPELHVDARYLAHAHSQFKECSFWRMDTGIAVRARHDFQFVGIILGRLPPPANRPCPGGEA